MDYEKLARGVDVAVEGKFVYLKVNTDILKAEDSSTGVMKLTASTSGFKDVDGINGFRVSVMGGYKNKK